MHNRAPSYAAGGRIIYGMANDWIEVGRLIRQARGTMTVTKAASAADVSRSWWQNVEAGSPSNAPKPEKLAAAVQAVDADLDQVFAAAGLDPDPFRVARRHPVRRATPAPESFELLAEVQRLWRAVERLADAQGVDPQSLRDDGPGSAQAAR